MSSTLYFKINNNGKFDLIERESCMAETRRYVVAANISKDTAIRICAGQIETVPAEIADQQLNQQAQTQLEKLKRDYPEALLEAAEAIIKNRKFNDE